MTTFKQGISKLQGYLSDAFSILATTLGIAIIIDWLLPYKLGVVKRIVADLVTIGITGPVVAILAVTGLVLTIYIKKR